MSARLCVELLAVDALIAGGVWFATRSEVATISTLMVAGITFVALRTAIYGKRSS